MSMLSRRDFLKTGVTTVGAAALMPAIFRRTLGSLRHQTVHGAPLDNGRVLVVVQLAGGNDGLNTVIPVADGAYYDARPGISIAASEALPLNSSTGLNPNLSGLKSFWDQEMLAIVEGVGYAHQSFSHFVSMDIWQHADPALRLQDGWLGRYFEKESASQSAPFLGLAVGRELPDSCYSPYVNIPSLDSLNSYQFQGDPAAVALTEPRLRALRGLYEANALTPYGALFNGTIKTATTSVQTLQAAHQAYQPMVTYPNSPLAQGLRLVAEGIAGGLGLKLCHVSIGGFDTHADELTDQSRQLATLDQALNAFYADLKAHQLDSEVLIMTWSEFGRRVRANASVGTDHGSAAPLFYMGTPVKGGLYGQRPSLTNLDNGNLRYSVDFRSPYATALTWLQAPTAELLGGTFQPLPLLR